VLEVIKAVKPPEKEMKALMRNGATHFIGIGGSGMSALATILLQKGQKVSGSDLKNSHVLERLRQMGARIYLEHRAENLAPDLERVVVSSAINETNQELLEAKARGLPVLHRAQLLAELMQGQETIAVAGSHGKTTTTSMIALLLEKSGFDPTVIIGGELDDFGGSAKFGDGKYLVAEADESDGSFLYLFPQIAVITNIENDHLDHYHSLDALHEAFGSFVAKLPGDGLAVFCLDDLGARQVAEAYTGNKLTYALNQEADFTVQNLDAGARSAEVTFRGKNLGYLKLAVPGRHNLSNALAAVAVGEHLGIPFSHVANVLKGFKGAARRFQLTGERDGITIIDDYAHHPTELRAALNAARTINPKRVLAVFQPHRYSRTRLLAREFGSAFEEADILFLTKIYAAGEEPIPGIDSGLIAQAVKDYGRPPLIYRESFEELADLLKQEVRPGDLVLTLGAGDIYKVGELLLEKL